PGRSYLYLSSLGRSEQRQKAQVVRLQLEFDWVMGKNGWRPKAPLQRRRGHTRGITRPEICFCMEVNECRIWSTKNMALKTHQDLEQAEGSCKSGTSLCPVNPHMLPNNLFSAIIQSSKAAQNQS
ncbi:hypothetical protein J4Q44_G00116680, partial [Coregonus suidteri]